MSVPGFFKQLEKFVESSEGESWLERHGWVRSRDIINKALIVPAESDDILEEALVVIVGGDYWRIDAEDEKPPERGVHGKVALL